MTVCKYFLQGNCRFGNNCNFEHTRGQNQSYNQNEGYNQNRGYNQYNNSQNYNNNRQNNNNNNRYVVDNSRYQTSNNQPNQSTNLFSKLVASSDSSPKSNPFSKIASQQQTPTSQTKPTDPENLLNDQQFIEFISNDLKSWLNSQAWKLSSYRFIKGAATLPGLQDISPEEARFALYQAKHTNSYNQELQQYHLKYNQTIEIIKQLAYPDQVTKDFLSKYFNEYQLTKNNVQPTPATNPFMQIIQKKQQELNQSQSIQPQSLFQQGPQPVQGFMQQQQTNQIQTSGSFLFSDKSSPSNPFTQIASGQPASSLSTVNKSGFNNNQSPFNTNPQASSLFTQSPQSFSNETLNTPDVNPNPRIYSNTSELSEQDIKEFKSNKFTLGLIPQLPPSKQLCI